MALEMYKAKFFSKILSLNMNLECYNGVDLDLFFKIRAARYMVLA